MVCLMGFGLSCPSDFLCDPEYAKRQLLLLLREWYMHPNGQIPAYEFAFGDVNPPVHAWAAWRIYKITAARGARDLGFLERVFQKLLLNFTWWVNRKDLNGENLFSGGFLGLDNIGVFDRSKPLPDGGSLRQADGTAWMAFYCGTMLSMALELAKGDGTHIDLAYEDMASKFFEHFVQIIDAINHLGGTGLWDEADGFYYDQLQIDGQSHTLGNTVGRRFASLDCGRSSAAVNHEEATRVLSSFPLVYGASSRARPKHHRGRR